MIRQRRTDSKLEFNEEALRLYIDNLERIYNTVKARGAVMVLITWPIIRELAGDKEINRRLLLIYSNFTLSTSELLSWYERYIDTQRRFAAEHPDVILIDAAEAFATRDKRERISSFVDLSHLTAIGNREFADVILKELQEEGIV